MQKLKFQNHQPWIPYIILIITLTLTFLTTIYVSKATYTEDNLRFLNAVEDTTSSISSQMQTYIALLRGVAGLYAAEPNLTLGQFSEYINRLRLSKNYPGAQGIGFIQIITNNNKDAFIQYEQSHDETNFTITPQGTRSTYYVVRYLTLSNQHFPTIIGFDMGTDPNRLQAMEKARDLGMTTTSNRLLLWTKKKGTKMVGFLIFTPIYKGGMIPPTISERRANLVGFIYSAFTAKDLFLNIQESKGLPLLLNYQIYDGKKLTKANLIHDSRTVTKQPSNNYIPRFQTTRSILVGGEPWTISFTNHQQFDATSQQNLSPFIFIGGLLVSITFFLLSRSQYLAKAKAEITATKLQYSQKELEKAVGIRDNFISIASHELKTPVTSLKVYAEVLLRQFNKEKDYKSTDYLKKILRQIDKLTLLIQDLLDVSRIQSNQLTFRTEKFDLNTLVKEVIESTQQIANHHRIVLEGAVSKNVWGDRERISQVLINLLTNALKYSPKAKKVIVTLQDGITEAKISVKDFGIGINKEHQKKIFTRFYRINAKNEQTYPGLGIGLFISQAIIKRHGGLITIMSKKNNGSIFRFTIPYSKKQLSETG